MIEKSKLREIKREQKQSLFFRYISELIHKLSLEDKKLEGIYVTRIELSKGYTICKIYFLAHAGREYFHNVFDSLMLYRSSIRKNLARSLKQRKVPEIFFHYDEAREKSQKVEDLLVKIQEEK